VDGLGFLTGLAFGMVVGIALVLVAFAALLVWPRRRRPGGVQDPSETPDLAVTVTERFLNDLAVEQLRSIHLPVGTVEDVILDLKPGQEANVWITVHLPILGRLVGSVRCRLDVGPPPRAALSALSAGRVRLPGLLVGVIERRLNAEITRTLAHYPITLLGATTSDQAATVYLRADPHALSALFSNGRQTEDGGRKRSHPSSVLLPPSA
jgi:hypothetical protein